MQFNRDGVTDGESGVIATNFILIFATEIQINLSLSVWLEANFMVIQKSSRVASQAIVELCLFWLPFRWQSEAMQVGKCVHCALYILREIVWVMPRSQLDSIWFVLLPNSF